MKTTLEIPDQLFKRAKSLAARRGIPFRELVTEALAEKVSPRPNSSLPWLASFGALRHLKDETARIQRRIDDEFEVVDTED